MPNRIETMEHQGQLRRFYIDGDYNPAASELYRRSTGKLLCFHLGEMVLRAAVQPPFRLFSLIVSGRIYALGNAM